VLEEFSSGKFVVMAITWCSPSPRKHPPKQSTEEAEAREQKDDDEDENVQQLEQCARLYKCLEVSNNSPSAHQLISIGLLLVIFPITSSVAQALITSWQLGSLIRAI